MLYAYIALAVLLVAVVALAAFRWNQVRTLRAGNNRPSRNWNPFSRRASGRTLESVRAWTSAHSDPQVAQWIASLNHDQLADVTRDLREFARSSSFELDWVLNNTLERDENLKNELYAAVNQRLYAIFTAEKVSDDINTFEMYQQMTAHPRRQREQIHKLYSELVNQGIAPATPPDIVVASNRERHNYMLRIIQEAADTQWDRVSAVLSDVMQGEEQAAAQRRGRLSNPLRRNAPQTTTGDDAAADSTAAAPAPA